MKSKRKKLDAKALDLWSKLVRLKGICEICGAVKTGTNDIILTAHHLVSRSWSAGRHQVDNGACVCLQCHTLEKAAPEKFKTMISDAVGEVKLYILTSKYRRLLKISECELEDICNGLKIELKKRLL